VAELADAADSKSAGALLRVGSSPSTATNVLFGFSFHGIDIKYLKAMFVSLAVALRG
jgi:hypothetical protein